VADIAMFFVLGLLVFPSQLGSVFVTGTVLALWIALVARPVSAYVATIRSGFSRRERALIGWAGLRGGIPVVLATLPVINHVPGSLEFFNLVFFAVLVSTVVQGATISLLAARLGISAPAQDEHPGAPS
jgi:potassium/hydrogen antiporter